MREVMSDLLYEAGCRFNAKPAFSMVGDSALTYTELDQLSGRIAGGLSAAGIRPGDRVVLHLPNGWQWVAIYHALARMGAVIVPCNILLSAKEVAWMVADSQAVAQFIPEHKRTAITESENESVHSFTEKSLDELKQFPWQAPADVAPDALFSIGYTSGTTGHPKGAMLTHRAVFLSAANTATIHIRHPADRVLTALPFAHVYGNTVLNASLMAGCHLFALERFNAGSALQAISQHDISLFEGVPTMFYQMLVDPYLLQAKLTSLVRCTVGGQTMPVSTMDAIVARFGCPLLELWGMTEVAGPVISHSPYWPARHGSIGRAFLGLEIRIADLNDISKNAGTGTPGELMVRGAYVTHGYWRDPVSSAQALDAEGFFATGDIAQIDADGYISVVDRRKDMIITAGYNVYPAELEQVLAMHPAVAMAAVTGFKDEEKGEIAKAFVVLRPDTISSSEEIIGHCRVHLAAYKLPRQVQFVSDLPKTSTGKILRRALTCLEPEATTLANNPHSPCDRNHSDD